MKSSKKIAIVVAVIGVLWIASGFLFPNSKEATSDSESTAPQKLVRVRVRESVAEDFKDTVIVTGRTQGSRSVDLSAEISAQVAKTIKDKGHIAKKGDILVKLEIKDRAARLKEAQGRFEQRTIEYNAAKKLETKGFNSKVRLAQSHANMEESKALLASAKNELKKTNIIAPFDSVVDDRLIEVGAFVNVGDKLFHIVDLDPLEIAGFVSEREVQKIQLGKKTIAKLLNGTQIEGTVSFISAEANEKTRTFRIEVSLPNPDLKIKAGFTAELIIDAQVRRAHKISPSALSLNDIGVLGVKILDKNDTVRFVKIKILKDNVEAMWIDGLPEHVRLITVGQHFVLDGQKVDPVEAEGDGQL